MGVWRWEGSSMKKRSHTTERKGENFGCKKRRITQEEMGKKKKTNGGSV